MNNNYISLIAMLVAVFFSGVYLRGEAARKQDVKRELDLIREQQEQIINRVDEINRVTAERDALLLSRIDSARTYIDLLNAEEAHTAAKIAGYGDNIQALQTGIDKSLADIALSEGLAVTNAPVEVPASEQ
ncbi:MAG: hypothetical protein AAF564_08440 [Bacteroidota bacterium]